MSWNYRIVKYADNRGYGLHEVYYENEKPKTMTSRPVGFVGESKEEVQESLELALEDATTRPILEEPVEF